MIEDKFIFTSQAKRKIFITIGVGILLLIIGCIIFSMGGHHEGGHAEAAGHGGHGEDHGPSLYLRIIKDLWLTNVYFTGISIIGVFFIAFNYVAQAGWGAAIKRVPEAFGYYLPLGGILMLILFLVGGHDLFHWTHHYLVDPKDTNFDPLIEGKSAFLNTGFFVFRMILYFVLWILVWWKLRLNSLAEDLDANLKYHDNSIFWSAIFLVVFGITSSTSAWDWVMSIDPHFFSTMFGWYVFASWFVSGLAAITFITITLKENGYLPYVNSSHLHDLGKFMFAFSIFWTYIWFAQFLLIYYANIPEEAIYFVERLKNDVYSPIFFMNLFVNFFFPFLTLMTANAKRQAIILKVVAVAILIGHWFDFYIMMTPPLLKQYGGLDVNILFIELGIALMYLGGFIFLVMTGLSKAPLTAKNHPMLQESIHHHLYL
ncbi:MAG TPA: quinol:cytochrome C oxidoreductase [Cytophagaceae bacterium]|jgi:hypothetical protein